MWDTSGYMLCFACCGDNKCSNCFTRGSDEPLELGMLNVAAATQEAWQRAEQMLQSVVIAVLHLCFMGKSLAPLQVVVTIGVAIASYGEINFVVIGVILQLISVATESTRLTLVQILLQVSTCNLMPTAASLWAVLSCLQMPAHAGILSRVLQACTALRCWLGLSLSAHHLG